MKFNPREIALIALVAALTVVIGFVFYFIGNILPFPGNKFIIFAPFLGFMIYIIMKLIPKRGVIAATSTVFALVMINVHFFMGIAILGAGITTEAIVMVLFRDLKNEIFIKLAAALYPAVSFFWAFVVSVYLTGNLLFLMVDNWLVLAFLLVIIYLLGLGGTVIAEKFVSRRIEAAKRT